MFRTPLADGPPDRHARKPGLGSRLRQAVSGSGHLNAAPALLSPSYVALPQEEAAPDADAPQTDPADLTDLDPEGLIAADGSVDFDRLFQSTDLPPVAMPAEKAALILSTIPEDLPRRVKRLIVRTSLDTVNDFDGMAAAETARATVRDAEEKSRRIVRLLERFRGEQEAQRTRVAAEIAALEAQIAARRELLATAEQHTEAVRQVCHRRTDAFDQVIVFFSVEARIRAEGGAAESEEPEDEISVSGEPERPAFLDEEAVMRLLGITRAGAPRTPADDSDLSVMPPAAGVRGTPARPRHTGSLVPP